MVKLIQFLKDSLLVFISLFLTSSAVTAQIGDTIVSLTPTYRNVLLEEYTGVGCSWCPDGHRMANELAAELPGHVNIINIHTGYLAYNTYTTQFGTALADQTNLDGYPSGTINRHVFSGSGTALNRGYWRSAAYQISQITSPVNIAAEGTLDYATRTLHVRIQLYYTGSQSVTSNALNLAIIQDNVLGAQNGMDFNPSQIVDGQYNHMHMLRHLVTGQWGETIYTVSQGTLVEKTYDYVIPEQLGSPNPINAVLDNLRFIAFVCEGHQEVLTSIEVPIQRINLPAINGALLSVNELENVECNEHGNAYFEFQNKGANTVTSLVYTYMVNNGAVQTATWNGNIPSWGTDTIHTPILNLNLNTINTVTVQVNAINGMNVNLTSKSGTIKKNVSSCGGDMTFTLVTDRYASETTFKIFDPEGNVVLSGGPWANLSYNGTTTHTYSFEPQIGGCHRLEVYDLYGDGINSGFGAGYFMMIQNEGNVELFLDNGQFGEKATYMIDISTQTPPCTTVYSEFYNTACDNYTWYGATYTQSGDYTHTFTNASGCDSVVTLHLTLKHSETVEYAETACGSYIWNDSVYTLSGDYVQTFTNADGCDSVVTLHLTVDHGYYMETTVDTCGAEFYWTLSDTTVTQSGTYYHYSANTNGCIDTAVLILSLHQSVTVEFSAQICEGESYNQNGFNVSTDGDHQLNLHTVHGCDSTVILHLTVGNEAITQLTAAICEGDSYNENGFDIITPEVGTHEYSLTFERPAGCDSVVTLHLTVNPTTYGDTTAIVCDRFDWYEHTNLTQSGDYTHTFTNASGCDSVVTLHLTLKHSETVEYAKTACDSYLWNDAVYTESGDYVQTFTNADGCDSVVTLHLTLKHSETVEYAETACDSYIWNDSVYTQSGDYVQTFTNADGCDSVVTLHLTVDHGYYMETTVDTCGAEFYWTLSDTTVTQSGTYYHYSANTNGCIDTAVLILSLHQSVTVEFSAQICEGESYNQNGFNVSTDGDHQLNLHTVHGCDSTVILHLTVGNEAITQLTAAICEGDSYNENGFDIITPEVGTHEYSLTFERPAGCDSVVTLHLTVNPTTYGDTTAIVCDRFDWYEHTNLTQSGDYTHTFTNASGCDSVVMLHLTLKHPETAEYAETACDSYIWNDSVYTQSGDYMQTFTTTSGCDSVVTLHLTLKHSETAEYAETACDSYIWNDSVYTQSGDYVQTFTATSGCDSIVTLHLIVTESPALQAISGEAGVCRNQFATYRYDISNLDYQYKWFKDNVLWIENVPEVTLHEMNEGFVLLTMQVSDEQSGCAADTSLTIHVLDHIAPNTTEIQRKPNSNILLCQSVTSDYGTVHYRWGYTDLLTYEEVIMPGDNNYCFYDIGIDTFAYLYWVETYLDGPIGSGCENRSYYGHDVTTYTSDYDANVVDAYMYGNCIVLNVSSLSVEDISATLYNVNGKLMLTRKYGHTDSVSDNIPVSFAPGVYFLKVSVGSKLYSFKLLKI